MRLTADVDIVLDSETANVRKALDAFQSLGYRPIAPVPLEQFADAAARDRWAREKSMVALSLWSNQHPTTEIDLLLEPPFDFATAWRNAARLEVAPGIEAVFLGLDDLIQLKQRVGRPRDIDDIEALRQIRQDDDRPTH